MIFLILFSLLSNAHFDDTIKFKATVTGKIALQDSKGSTVVLKNNDVVMMSNHTGMRKSLGLRTLKRNWNYDRDLYITLPNKQKIIFEIPGSLMNLATAEYSVHKSFTGQPAHIVRSSFKRPIKQYERDGEEDCVAEKYCAAFGYSVDSGYSATIKPECKGKMKVRQIVKEYDFIRTWHIYYDKKEQGEVLITAEPEKREDVEKIKELSVCVKAN